MVKAILKMIAPEPALNWLRSARRQARRAALASQGLGALRRVTPVNSDWGDSRGQCIDRYYIERFLHARASDVRGAVLEFSDGYYTAQFGGPRVTSSDVLHLTANPKATIVGDLAVSAGLPAARFDCIICTQVLLLVYDVRAAIRNLHHMLKPGGVVLVTVPGVAHKIVRPDMDLGGDYWRFTSRSIRRLFEEVFPPASVEVKPSGNVLAAIGFLHGLATEDLSARELDYFDPDYEVSIALRAVKS
jgi:SAM-dependent methyltransferase